MPRALAIARPDQTSMRVSRGTWMSEAVSISTIGGSVFVLRSTTTSIVTRPMRTGYVIAAMTLSLRAELRD